MVGGSTATNHFCHNHQPKMSIIPESELSEGVGQKRNSGLRPRDSLIIIALQGPRGERKGMWRTQCGKSHGERGILARAPPARRREKARAAWLIPAASCQGKCMHKVCKTLYSGTCLKMTTTNPATKGYRAFASHLFRERHYFVT